MSSHDEENEGYGEDSVLLDMDDVSQRQVDPEDFDNVFELIRKIEFRPFLYNSRDPNHSKRDVVTQAWNDIATGIKVKGKEVNGAWCKKKWKTLRDYYYKVKRTLKGHSGDEAKDKKPWTYFNAMNRVLSSINEENVNTQSNLPGDDSSASEIQSSVPQTPSDDAVNSCGEFQEKAGTKESTPYIRRVQKRQRDANEKILNEKIMKVLEEPEEEKDQFYHFGMTLCKKLRKMPSQLAEYSMIRMNSLLYDIMYTVEMPVISPHQSSSDETTQNMQ